MISPRNRLDNDMNKVSHITPLENSCAVSNKAKPMPIHGPATPPPI